MWSRRSDGRIQAIINHQGSIVAIIFVDQPIVPGEIVTYGTQQAHAVRVDGTTTQTVHIGTPWRAGP